MEKHAYTIAHDKGCIEERDNQRMAMSELFDYISGTQSGSITAVMLSLKDEDQKQMYWAEDIGAFFSENANSLFQVTRMTKGQVAMWYIITITLAALIGFGISTGIFYNPNHEDQAKRLRDYIETYRRWILKNKKESSLAEKTAIRLLRDQLKQS
jgi:hypothetical protein